MYRGRGVPGRGHSRGRSQRGVVRPGPAVVDVAGPGLEGRCAGRLRGGTGTWPPMGHGLSGRGGVRRLGHGASFGASWDGGMTGRRVRSRHGAQSRTWRSEERRVGKECRSRGSADQEKGKEGEEQGNGRREEAVEEGGGWEEKDLDD